MFSIAILDEDNACLNEIISMTERWRELSCEEWQIRAYTDEEQLLKDAEKDAFSLYLLDVVLSGTNGIFLAKRLRLADPDAVVVFISSSAEYAAESYDVKAFYYLLKPVSEEKLFEVLTDAAAIIKKRQLSLIVKTQDGTEHLLFAEICYAELRARRVRYVCKNRIVTGLQLTGSFKDAVLPLLEKNCAYCAFIHSDHGFYPLDILLFRLRDRRTAFSYHPRRTEVYTMFLPERIP